ncbi:MAG: hypothetical protein QXX35_04830 [Desulfurococcaceae archaeon]
MVKRTVRGRSKSILDYLASSTDVSRKSEQSVEVKKTGSTDSSSSNIDLLIKELVFEKKRIESNRVETKIDNTTVEKSSELLSKPQIPTGDILDEILEKGLGLEDIVCNSDGKCSDGLSVGEVFTDKYGFRRKRGYVNTTRLPIFLDWILEEIVVKEIMPKTYVVETNLGSRAIIPEDYLCEFQYRYGLTIKNYDKCVDYRPIITRGEIEKKRKKIV